MIKMVMSKEVKRFFKYLWLKIEGLYLYSPLINIVMKFQDPNKTRSVIEREIRLIEEELEEARSEGRDVSAHEQHFMQLKWEYQREVENGLWQK